MGIEIGPIYSWDGFWDGFWDRPHLGMPYRPQGVTVNASMRWKPCWWREASSERRELDSRVFRFKLVARMDVRGMRDAMMQWHWHNWYNNWQCATNTVSPQTTLCHALAGVSLHGSPLGSCERKNAREETLRTSKTWLNIHSTEWQNGLTYMYHGP